ncbi:MAG: hypothetical protein F4Y18_00425 [Cenarchaeum sp. SB0663_bin_5]|nr:hypothetical protein [Cenarchaeum sp. SB0663_bin_5]MYH04660.1 hypothetical protein [Cenarchaeum sp. SB0675_bin_21]
MERITVRSCLNLAGNVVLWWVLATPVMAITKLLVANKSDESLLYLSEATATVLVYGVAIGLVWTRKKLIMERPEGQKMSLFAWAFIVVMGVSAILSLAGTLISYIL